MRGAEFDFETLFVLGIMTRHVTPLTDCCFFSSTNHPKTPLSPEPFHLIWLWWCNLRKGSRGEG